MIERKVVEIIPAQASSDGAGVKLLRVFGGQRPERFDPFILLDEFGSSEPDDYLAGFPPHPHRGFETVTYMLQGKMEHRDHMENVGLLSDGDVQWMTAGSGVIHSEMPKQTEGKMRGFQLWVNLPAEHKMTPARYQDVPAKNIPVYEQDGVFIKAIAGQAQVNGSAVKGYFTEALAQPTYLDIHAEAGQSVNIPVAPENTLLVYVYEGELALGENQQAVKAQQLARLMEGDLLAAKNISKSQTRFLVLSAKPLQEPIKQYGPFVMNTQQQIEQALQDYRAGVLTDVD